MSSGMVIEWEGRLYEAIGLDYPCMDSVLAYDNGKPVVKRMRESLNRFLILRPIEGPTRAELAEALLTARHCEDEIPCGGCVRNSSCPWREWLEPQRPILRDGPRICGARRTAILNACRAAGLLPQE